MEDAIRESRFLQAMTYVANKVLEAEREQVYDLVMEEAEQFIREFLGSSHDGGAYALWLEISDLYDNPAGPASEEACEEIGRKAAAEWLSVDKSSPDEIDKFFARWQTPEPRQIS
ncbi:hypothetical protein StoSoilA2_11950 [Arthrobacter sp. StoSoilA2]|uniref:hypothetical protein n=1 Tax=Arthrobacter sp. StoSoilA2 TaxID=2830990 RepID=UPI001CC4863A|nr:hypothetical protein [Arthrobacter sp. StoSoilA2]BCW35139.1 hypothetical protein StoSoilA2_11950 [Arthrobacter sp. StoSoilA2]